MRKYLLIIFGYLLLFIQCTNTSPKKVCRCADSQGTNYDSSATHNNDSSTQTIVTLTPDWIKEIDDAPIEETSGLILWNNSLFTMNDDTDTHIYELNTKGEFIKKYKLKGVTNVDWEEISQDEDFIYIGDFGNNAAGNRKDLKIYKILKGSLSSDNPQIETINFSYSNQTDFSVQRKTDFDCEAMIVTSENIFLFTKQWTTQATCVYILPKVSGNHQAKLIHTFDVKGLITGATYVKNKNLIALTGYNTIGETFMYILNDFKNNDFFSGKIRKFVLGKLLQTEGIASDDGINFYVSNETFNNTHSAIRFYNLKKSLGF